MSLLTQRRLKELLSYNPDTGVFIRLVATSNVKAGSVAGSTDSYGYRQIRIDGRLTLAHRLAWLYVHDAWPVGEIDHKNGIRDDNRISNLRDVSHVVNMQNSRKPRSNNTSGFPCVTLDKRRGRWQSVIRVEGRLHSLGYYETPEFAYGAHLAAKRKRHEGNTI